MAYLGTKPANTVITSQQIADGVITPSDLSTGKPVWDTSGNVGVGTSSPSGASGRTLAINGGAGQARLALKNNTSGDDANDGFQLVLDAGGDAAVEQRENATLNFLTNSINRMRIDASGRVTMPFQPAFLVNLMNGSTFNTGTLTGGTVQYDVSSNYNTSTGRFTAPIAGRYFFAMSVLVQSGGGRLEGNMNVNGGLQRVNFNGTGTTFDGPTAIAVFNLAAGDFVQIVRMSGTAFSSAHENFYFTGYLLG